MVTTGFALDLEKLIINGVNALGFELVGVEFDIHSNPKLLRVYADVAANKVPNDDGARVGITLDDCGKISYHLNKVLSVTQDLQLGNYVLEVSSPGLERRLFNLLQIEQHLNKEVRLRLTSPFNGRSNFVGMLKGVDHSLNRVFLEIDGQDLYFNFDNIAKVNLVYRKL